MEAFEFEPPTDLEIEEAQRKLNFIFPIEYINFIKSSYDLGETTLEALEICNPGSHVDIYTVIADARKYYGLPKELLPICEDNSDYYCLNNLGEIIYWSHNGLTDEKWKNITEWRNQMIAEATE